MSISKHVAFVDIKAEAPEPEGHPKKRPQGESTSPPILQQKDEQNTSPLLVPGLNFQVPSRRSSDVATVFKKMFSREQVLLVHTAHKMSVLDASVTPNSYENEIDDLNLDFDLEIDGDDHDDDIHYYAKKQVGKGKSGMSVTAIKIFHSFCSK